LGATTALGLTAQQAAGAEKANDRVRLGFIGVGNRGTQLLRAFYPQPDAEIAAVCDVDKNYLERAKSMAGGRPDTYGDFRKMLERKDLDAIVIATPDHWHAIQTIMACQAGKDVYVEKPLSITIYEGRKMVEAVRKYDRVCQVGTHRRSTEAYAKLADLVQSGRIGKVTVARAYRLSNMWPDGMGKAVNSEPPAHLDWDMWLGPRPKRPFNENIAPYKFRWWHLYSSQVANWGVHYFDVMRWVLGDKGPCSVSAHGGKFAIDDDRTVPDTLESISEMPTGRFYIFGQYEASGNPALRSGEVEFRGTIGTAYSHRKGFEVVPEKGGQFQDRKPRMEPVMVKTSDGDPTVNHVRNFLDCVKSRKRPNADIEDGHRSTSISLLVNIAWLTRSRIEWDADKERITNNADANKLLHYEYRKPWKLPS
jgi:predicted dehydrogenase